MKSLILASGSPRRKELLEIAHLSFTVQKSSVSENITGDFTPAQFVELLALHKAQDIYRKNPSHVVLGADTVVVFNNQILGKPENDKEAFDMLAELSGQTHHVFTGTAIISEEKEIIFHGITEVKFWNLTSEEIEEYVSTGESSDKAGAYGIQGYGSTLVKEIKGDFFNVVGLPLARTVRELKKFGITNDLSQSRNKS
ncbi:Maf family protein [Pseudalkalibacillus salsuginis]|uniref:Maf family protein n=1 Tax=Pseudalkalibacillus salsuginis TaxID=2910972 RepID=UPI001F1B794F|nr:Maf family protein [Pseudalkalibacillus salsuginis]MCF6408665.1 Maf family protein [Pseudalkalibacillus salsuginis]